MALIYMLLAKNYKGNNIAFDMFDKLQIPYSDSIEPIFCICLFGDNRSLRLGASASAGALFNLLLWRKKMLKCKKCGRPLTEYDVTFYKEVFPNKKLEDYEF